MPERFWDPLRHRIRSAGGVEHVTTCDGVDYVRQGGDDIAATITTHHLFINRNHILAGGIRPHNYCLPLVAKREVHRLALVAAPSLRGSIFFSELTAPRMLMQQNNLDVGAGIYTAPNTMSCLAAFVGRGRFDKLEGFVSRHGPAFYRLPVNAQTITLIKRDTPIEFLDKCETPDGAVTIFDCGQPLFWEEMS